MTNFTFNGPGGQQITIDAPTHDDAVRQLHDRVANPRSVGQPGHPNNITQPVEDFGSTPANFAAGTAQGLLDIPEGLGQLAEHIPYVGGAVRAVVPQGARDWLKNFQRRAESTEAGDIGEFAGNVVPFLFQPELGIASRASALGKVPGFLGRVFERGTLPAIAQPTPEQPPQQRGRQPTPDDFWKEKGIQALTGTGIGTLGEGVASALTRVGRGSVARQAAAKKAAADYATAVAEHQRGSLARAAEQQAAKDAKAAKDKIPDETTLRWYRETLGRIGLADQAPTEVTPEASARVQKIVGGRINDIIGRMKLNSSDQNFVTARNTIRDEVMRDLPESAQNNFYKVPKEQTEEPLLYDQYGKPFSRRTRTGELPKPSGDWVKTVEEPLAKGDLEGRALTDYISRLGARAEELARKARTVPQDQRAELYAMSNAYRQVEDAVIGHATGKAEDKLELEAARKAYSMWSIGNDAGRAAQGGVMTPTRLIQQSAKRMGEARYKQMLDNPQHTDNSIYKWVHGQQRRLEEPLPKVRPATEVPPHPGKVRAEQPSSVAHHAGSLMAAYAAAHTPGHHFATYHATRPFFTRMAHAIAPAVAGITRGVSRIARRAEVPVSAGVSDIVKQTEQEPSMSYRFASPQ